MNMSTLLYRIRETAFLGCLNSDFQIINMQLKLFSELLYVALNDEPFSLEEGAKS